MTSFATRAGRDPPADAALDRRRHALPAPPWADSGPHGRQALVVASFARLDVLGFERLECERTADAIGVGLDAALRAALEMESRVPPTPGLQACARTTRRRSSRWPIPGPNRTASDAGRAPRPVPVPVPVRRPIRKRKIGPAWNQPRDGKGSKTR